MPNLKCVICSLGIIPNVFRSSLSRKVWAEFVWVLERTVGYFTIWSQNINHSVGIAYARNGLGFFFFNLGDLKYIYIYRVCLQSYFKTFRKNTCFQVECIWIAVLFKLLSSCMTFSGVISPPYVSVSSPVKWGW